MLTSEESKVMYGHDINDEALDEREKLFQILGDDFSVVSLSFCDFLRPLFFLWSNAQKYLVRTMSIIQFFCEQ